MSKKLRSFRPISDAGSRILILGTMPGPVALARREYYGFPGNHFWPILADVLGEPRAKNYREKKAILKKHRVALWDTVASCTRAGALDSAMRCIRPNDIARLLRRRPGIHAVFLNGKTAERLYRTNFAKKLHVPAVTLPSTSPANASMPFEKKREAWKRAILPALENRNPWC